MNKHVSLNCHPTVTVPPPPGIRFQSTLKVKGQLCYLKEQLKHSWPLR